MEHLGGLSGIRGAEVMPRAMHPGERGGRCNDTRVSRRAAPTCLFAPLGALLLERSRSGTSGWVG